MVTLPVGREKKGECGKKGGALDGPELASRPHRLCLRENGGNLITFPGTKWISDEIVEQQILARKKHFNEGKEGGS